MGKGLIWPWNIIFKDKSLPREKIVGRLYKTLSGQVIDEKDARRLANEVRNAMGVSERLLADAKALYDEGKKIEAIVTVTRAQAVLGPLANQVRENPDLPPLADLVKPVENMDFEINTKCTQWRRELDINDADRLREALKAAELLPDEESHTANNGSVQDDNGETGEGTAAEEAPAAEENDEGKAEGGAETPATIE